MRRSALVLLVIGSLISLGSWWSRRPPAWLSADPLRHPFGHGLEAIGSSPTVPGAILDQAPLDAAHPLAIWEADAAELQRLPGVGPVLAARILAQRDSLGGLHTPEQLDAVPGIGPKLLARLLPLLRFASADVDSVRDL